MKTKKLQKKLDAHGFSKFRVRCDGFAIYIEGESESWDEIVTAGLLCAERKSRFWGGILGRFCPQMITPLSNGIFGKR